MLDFYHYHFASSHHITLDCSNYLLTSLHTAALDPKGYTAVRMILLKWESKPIIILQLTWGKRMTLYWTTLHDIVRREFLHPTILRPFSDLISFVFSALPLGHLFNVHWPIAVGLTHWRNKDACFRVFICHSLHLESFSPR